VTSATLLALCASLVFAQSELPVFRADTNLQSIAVQVTDNRGNHIQGLSASNFTLLENGKPQKIAFFGADAQPVSLAVLVDSSTSMAIAGKLEQARVLLATLLHGNRADDEISLMQFDDKVGPFARLTPEQRSRPVVLDPLLGSGGTAFYDALASALCHMRTAQNIRQAVVVITDGADQHSRLDLEQVIQLARSSSAQVFTIGFFSKDEHEIFGQREKKVALANGHEIDNPAIMFERLARESGAESFFPSSNQDFRKALDRIAALLEAQYTLAYYPARLEGLRKIEVKVNHSGVHVSARRSVGSDESGEPVHFSATGCAVSAKDHPYPWESRTSLSSANTRIYREDFTDPRSGWPNRVGKSDPSRKNQPESTSSSRYVAGGYELSWARTPGAPPRRGLEGAIAAYGPWWKNFRASAVIESTKSINSFESAAGMVFDVAGPGYYALLLAGNGNKLAYTLIRRHWSGAGADIIPWTFITSNRIDPAAKGHKLAVESNRGQIILRVDDLELDRVKEDEFDGGTVGFGTFGGGRTIVRDLVVEELP